ncbi:MAG: 4Fe-4S binding protein [Methanoregulaceae archaeon]|nr:4Fe-4S binding protein [Methanoregulaceae archaeon]
MRRKIIDIDGEKCTGCGQCIPDCPEGALHLIEGKARLVSDLFCDGLGACIGTCPEGAITVIEREAGAYDERAVMNTIVSQGQPVIKAHLEHLLGHGERNLYSQAIACLKEQNIPVPDHAVPEFEAIEQSGNPPSAIRHPSTHFAGCPGSAARTIPRGRARQIPGQPPEGSTSSELRQWPVQLKLLNSQASFFENSDLLISADCVSIAYPDFHRDFLKGKIVIIFCPKLDSDIEGYITKLTDLLARHAIRSITILHMEVPCCNGVTYIVNQALERSGKEIPVKEYTIAIEGQVV